MTEAEAVAASEEVPTQVRTCILVSREGEKLEVPLNVAQLSGLVKEMTSDAEEDEDNIEIPVSEASIETLEKVVVFCKYHVDVEWRPVKKPLPAEKIDDFSQIVPKWDAEFLQNEPVTAIADLLKAANFLDIKSLLDLTCAKIASLVRGRTKKEMRETFGLTEAQLPEGDDKSFLMEIMGPVSDPADAPVAKKSNTEAA
eukprot:CAMPEP_0171499736 /NCGR_PEP_ID=MMETSP0958-20121227/8595_1 /TAXON_ID=87120 /ORGANISM="Aurantiochytrium limacinum, Strain ATCCMYA-1381" /LENGTH=198 /DNA_ID=CAMNT_0012034327 /DNA_START=17 /DNA_END=613 /DNA_ORIENTATION=+